MAASNFSIFLYEGKGTVYAVQLNMHNATQLTTTYVPTYNDRIVAASQDITISYLDPLAPQKLDIQTLYTPGLTIRRLHSFNRMLVLVLDEPEYTKLELFDIDLAAVVNSSSISFKVEDLLMTDFGIVAYGSLSNKGQVQVLERGTFEVNWESSFPSPVTAAAHEEGMLILAVSEWVSATQVFVLGTHPLVKLYGFHIHNVITSLLLVGSRLYVGDSIESVILYELTPKKETFVDMATKNKFTSGLCRLDDAVVELDKRGNLTVYQFDNGLKPVTFT